jgi:hypothetical protein
MTTTIDKLHAVGREPVNFLPSRLDANAIDDVLERLDPGLALPGAVKALAASEMPLGATGHKINLAALDKALSQTSLTSSERIRFKLALAAERLLAGHPGPVLNHNNPIARL